MFWKYLAVVVGSLVAMAVGLGLAYAWEPGWLRVVAMTAPIAVAGLAVTLLKRRNERADRDAAAARTR
ncbi:hypothetical protein [Microbacterium arborescens]|uniref:hypothetical protein n=1 Tax=Microbacterium arborescens TaxID=33883 RepID=UPI000DF75448|nr:hypothetical protein [Microbacterium arborescens]